MTVRFAARMALALSPSGRGQRVRQSDLFFDGQTPLEGHLDVASVDQGGTLTHGNVTGNTNQATELAETATQHARLPSPLACSLKHCPHTSSTKMWVLPSRLTSWATSRVRSQWFSAVSSITERV